MSLCDVYTVATSLAGLPIQGRVLDDAALLQVARAFERELALSLPWPSSTWRDNFVARSFGRGGGTGRRWGFKNPWSARPLRAGLP